MGLRAAPAAIASQGHICLACRRTKHAYAGVGWARVSSPDGPVDTFNTHLHANYSHKYEHGRHARSAALSSEATSTPPAKAAGAKGGKAKSGKRGVGGGGGSGGAAFKVPQDRFAPYRVSQVGGLRRGHTAAHTEGASRCAALTSRCGPAAPHRTASKHVWISIHSFACHPVACDGPRLEPVCVRWAACGLNTSPRLASQHTVTALGLGCKCVLAFG